MEKQKFVLTKNITRDEYERNAEDYRNAVISLKKTDKPLSLRLFLINMHNFYLNFSPEWIGDFYRKQKPYLAAMHVDGFNELAKGIRENLNQVGSPTLAVYIFTEDYKQVHLDLHKAYLIMRGFVEEKDIEMFR